jgi:phosphatidylserine decarboxylase
MTAGAAGWGGGLVVGLAMLPLVWKWQLGTRRCLVGIGVIAVVAGAIALAGGEADGLSSQMRGLLGASLTAIGAVTVLAYRFYRDPERPAPQGGGLVVSPADGEIVYVKRSRNGRLPVACKHGEGVALEELTRTAMHDRDAVVVGIAMSFLDVHVNRAPIAGRVVLRRHFPGRFGSLRNPEMAFQNERTTTLIAGSELEVAVVQIASRLVRQIGSHVSEGDEVRLGQRIGVIRLGSQVDLVIPLRRDLSVLVGEGDRVYAGSSVIATIGATPVSARSPAGATIVSASV